MRLPRPLLPSIQPRLWVPSPSKLYRYCPWAPSIQVRWQHRCTFLAPSKCRS